MDALLNEISKAPHSQYMYYVADVPFPEDTSKELSLLKIRELILSLDQNFDQLKFRWMRLDGPEHGNLFVIVRAHPQNPKLPGDGYRWLNPEATVRQHDMEISYRLNGQRLQDMSQLMSKIRYRWLGNRSARYLQVIHYLRQVQVPQMVHPPTKFPKPVSEQVEEPSSPDAASSVQNIPVVPSVPTTSLHLNYFATNQRQGPDPKPEGTSPKSSSSKPSSSSSSIASLQGPSLHQQRSQYPPKSSEESLIDDIPELISVRDFAAKRYVRNHEYMDEIFSPKTADPSKHTQSNIEISMIEQRMEAATKSIDIETEKWQKRKEHHLNYTTNIENALNQLSSIRTHEDLNKLIENVDSMFSWNTVSKKRRSKPFIERISL